MSSEYYLEYTCKKTSVKFVGKRLTGSVYRIKAEGSNESVEINQTKLFRNFIPSEANRGFRCRVRPQVSPKKKHVKINSEAFQAYLRGSNG